MKSIASAPGKVILFGEHFVVYGVKAILCSINKRVTVTAEKTSERKISINSKIGKLYVISGDTNNPFKVGEEVFLSLDEKDVKVLND